MSPRRSRRTLAVAILTATAGCVSGRELDTNANSAEGLEAPAAVIDVSGSRAPPLHFGAGDVAGSSSVCVTERDSDTLLAKFVLLPNIPENASAPLDDLVRAVIDPDTGTLLLTSELARDAFVLEGVSASELLARRGATGAGDAVAAFPVDVSVRVALRTERPSSTGSPRSSGQEPGRRELVEVAFVVRRDGKGELEWMLELSRGKREIVWLGRRAVPASGRVTFVVRSPFSKTFGSSTPWLAVGVAIAPGPAPMRAVAELRAGLAAEGAAVGRDHPLHRPGVDREPSAPELAAFRDRFAAAPREALVELGRHDDLVIALDAALTLPEAAFRAVARAIERRLRNDAALGAVTSRRMGEEPLRPLGLEVDLAALEVLLSPELRASSRALVERTFGAAFSSDLADAPLPFFPVARLATNRGELERLVLLSNLIALDSSRPYVRLRAARFLEARAPGLEGFDSLGTFERRSESVGRLWTRLAPGESRP